MMLSNNWGELLLPGIRKLFELQLKTRKDYVATLFNVQTSKKAAETHMGIGEMGLMQDWNDTGRSVYYADYGKGYSKTYTHQKYSLGITVERELLDDDQYDEIRKRTVRVANACAYTRQKWAADVFNNAFSNAQAGPDGVALCSASHPLSPTNATTWSNTDALELNAANLETVRTRMMGWTDDKGKLLVINPDSFVLLVPPALRKAALVIANSSGEPDQNDHNVNIWEGSVKVIEWQMLSDANAWFLCEQDRMKEFLNWFDRRPLDVADYAEYDTEISKFRAITRISKGWDHASFLYGCNPS